jgi:hypothetical protein
MWRWLFIAIVALGAWHFWSMREVAQPPGILVAAEPAQLSLDERRPSLSKPGYRITPLERISLDARVLGAERYWLDRGADLAPIDLALGWGPMSDSAVIGQIDISQGGRFYFWHVDRFPIPRQDIEVNSANMHMIPADANVEDALNSLRVGQLVHISGYLVEAIGTDGWRWRSSLIRSDTGNGACELVWVEDLRVD